MNGMSVAAEGAAGANPGPNWHVKDAGDFNADSKADILWQNDNGQAAIWLMNGGTTAITTCRSSRISRRTWRWKGRTSSGSRT